MQSDKEFKNRQRIRNREYSGAPGPARFMTYAQCIDWEFHAYMERYDQTIRTQGLKGRVKKSRAKHIAKLAKYKQRVKTGK